MEKDLTGPGLDKEQDLTDLTRSISHLQSLLEKVEHNRSILRLLRERLDMLDDALNVFISTTNELDTGLRTQTESVLKDCLELVQEHTDLCGKSWLIQMRAYCSNLKSCAVANRVPLLNKRLELCACTLKAFHSEVATGSRHADGEGVGMHSNSTRSLTEHVQERTVEMEDNFNGLFFLQKLKDQGGNEDEVAELESRLEKLDLQLDWSQSITEWMDGGGECLQVGAGRLGQVFHCIVKGRHVAVRLLPRGNVLHFGDNLAEFGSENAFLMGIQHKHVLQVYGANLRKEPPSIFMEWAEEGSLHSLDTASLSWSGKVDLMLQAAKGLNHLHKMQRTHQDVTSEHILVATDPETVSGYSVKIAGLGMVSTKNTTARITNWRKSAVSPLAPPEFHIGVTKGRRSDVFQFGVVMYELVGTRPTVPHGVEITKAGLEKHFGIPADCPTSLKAIMADCCAADASRRPSMMDAEKRLEDLFQSLLDLQKRDFGSELRSFIAKSLATCRAYSADIIYNQQMLDFMLCQMEKVGEICDQIPSKPETTSQQLDWRDSCADLQSGIELGTRLIARHRDFDLKRFYKVEEAHDGILQVCDVMSRAMSVWRLQLRLQIETYVPQESVDEDRRFLTSCLTYVLWQGKLVLDDADARKWEVVGCKWEAVKAQHARRCEHLRIINADELVWGSPIRGAGRCPVYRGKFDGRDVAIKKLSCDEDPLHSLEDFFQFFNEAVIQASLQHDHIAVLIAVTRCRCLVMELAECDLQTLYQRKHMDMKLKARLLLQVAQGLAHMHEAQPPVVHNDVKSPNILIFGDLNDLQGCTAKVADFGISAFAQWTAKPTARGPGGTAHWMSPEAYEYRHPTPASDVYSLGVIMYELASENFPFGRTTPKFVIMDKKMKGEAPCSLPPDCSPGFEELMQECCALKPADRPPMQQVVERLSSLEILMQGDMERIENFAV